MDIFSSQTQEQEEPTVTTAATTPNTTASTITTISRTPPPSEGNRTLGIPQPPYKQPTPALSKHTTPGKPGSATLRTPEEVQEKEEGADHEDIIPPEVEIASLTAARLIGLGVLGNSIN